MNWRKDINHCVWTHNEYEHKLHVAKYVQFNIEFGNALVLAVIAYVYKLLMDIMLNSLLSSVLKSYSTPSVRLANALLEYIW